MIKNIPVSSYNPYKLRRNIGYVIQDRGLFLHLTIEDNIATVPKLLGWKKKKIKNITYELLEMPFL